MRSIKRIEVQSAYILYTRPFRETSLLLEVFSKDHGRVSLVAKGARRARYLKNSKFHGLLQPFVPLLLSWRGRGDLFNLTNAEASGAYSALEGRLLVKGWYMNELLVRTLKHWDPYPPLFLDYQIALEELAHCIPWTLRRFEKNLLTALGMMPSLQYQTKTGQSVVPHASYLFSPIHGVSLCKDNVSNAAHCFSGNVLLAVENNNWQLPSYGPPMKRLLRMMLDHVLGGKPLRSRDLLYK